VAAAARAPLGSTLGKLDVCSWFLALLLTNSPHSHKEKLTRNTRKTGTFTRT